MSSDLVPRVPSLNSFLCRTLVVVGCAASHRKQRLSQSRPGYRCVGPCIPVNTNPPPSPEGANMTTSGPYDAPGTSSATTPVTGTSNPTRPVTGASNPTRPVTGADSPTRAVAYRDDERRHARETKPSFKTTELIVYLLSVLGVLIASWVVDVNDDGQRFSAYQGWFLVTLLTIGYLISRGLAKSGSRDETR